MSHKPFTYSILVATVFTVPFANASAKVSGKIRSVSAAVLTVEERETPSNYVGGSPTDAPLQADVHVFEVSLRLGCGTYVGQYKVRVQLLARYFDAEPCGGSSASEAHNDRHRAWGAAVHDVHSRSAAPCSKMSKLADRQLNIKWSV